MKLEEAMMISVTCVRIITNFDRDKKMKVEQSLDDIGVKTDNDVLGLRQLILNSKHGVKSVGHKLAPSKLNGMGGSWKLGKLIDTVHQKSIIDNQSQPVFLNINAMSLLENAVNNNQEVKLALVEIILEEIQDD